MAHGAATRSDIAKRSLVDTRTLTKYLAVLEERELIERMSFLGSDDAKALRKTDDRYRIADPYFRFWFRFLSDPAFPVASRAEAASQWDEKVEPFFAAFSADVFREVCRQHVERLGTAGKLPFAPDVIGPWRTKDFGMDLVAATADRRSCLVADCFADEEKVGLKALRRMQGKSDSLPVPDDAEVHFWLFSRGGFEKPLRELADRDPYLHLAETEDLLD